MSNISSMCNLSVDLSMTWKWTNMEHDLRNVRVEEQLRINIGEAKNLPSRSHGSIGLRDVYCAINVNQEEIFRTSTVEKNLSPFFGEEFNFEVPPKFRFLSVYVHDQDNKKDKIIGKVSIKKENLHKYHGKDHWFPILNVDADSEVQGKVHIDLRVGKNFNTNGVSYKLLLKIVECSDLLITQGSCDPYVQIQLFYGQSRLEAKRTKLPVCCKGNNEDWDIFTYIGKEMDPLELKIGVFHDSSVFGNVFLGEVRIPLQTIDLKVGHNAWYFLKPRECYKTVCPDLGSLRLKMYYTSDHVFSSQFYEALKNLLLQSSEIQPITSSSAYILGQIVSNKVDAALPLVKIFLQHGRIVPFLSSLAKLDISKVTDTNTIFRGNTLMSKCMDEFMQLTGLHYLHNTLKLCIDQIISEHKPCEIDPSRLKEGECIKANLQNLMYYTTKIFEEIMKSALACPLIMCKVFSKLKDLATENFLENPGMRYVVISSFIFLRFFAPAILGPKLFDLSSDPIDGQTHRTFTLISKSLQTLGNHVNCTTPPAVFKEDYMTVLFKCFITHERIEAVRVVTAIRECILAPLTNAHFSNSQKRKVPENGDVSRKTARCSAQQVAAILDSDDEETLGFDEDYPSDELETDSDDNVDNDNDSESDSDNKNPVDCLPVRPVIGHNLDSGWNKNVMIKRAQGRKKFKIKNFKERYFCLTNQELFYSKKKGDSPLCSIPISEILAVEKLQEDSFKMKNMFQMVQKERALYVQANNCVELKTWIDLIDKVIQSNKNKLSIYHPAAFVGGLWQCCKQTVASGKGCTPVSSTSADITINIDADREVERIHSLFLSNMIKLEKLEDACEQQAVYSGDKVSVASLGFEIEDTQSLWETLNSIRTCVISLEQDHKQHIKNMNRLTKYGSEQAPIGDDNYVINSVQTAL
ncbi:Ras GTPase-activating protein 3 [Nymphon striatum]|nr:Ras GTPase-activating protein 3 [Nymphon striatum]